MNSWVHAILRSTSFVPQSGHACSSTSSVTDALMSWFVMPKDIKMTRARSLDQENTNHHSHSTAMVRNGFTFSEIPLLRSRSLSVGKCHNKTQELVGLSKPPIARTLLSFIVQRVVLKDSLVNLPVCSAYWG